jgi:hypothetical protein
MEQSLPMKPRPNPSANYLGTAPGALRATMSKGSR